MPSAVVTLNSQSYLLVNDDDGGPQASGVTGSERKQDLTPSTRDVVQGVPGDTDIASGSKIVYGDATGGFGLSDRTLAPGDMSRPFLSEADNTRMRQLTAWVGTGAGVALGTRTLQGGGSNATTVLVDAASGCGFLGISAGTLTWDFWQWDTASAAYKFVRAGYTAAAVMELAGYTPRWSYGNSVELRQRVTDYAGGLWYAASGGLVDLAVAAAAPVGDANTVHTLPYLDMLWSFGITTTGITITPYRFAAGGTPVVGNQVKKIDTEPGSATYGTAVNTICTIPGEKAITGVIAAESNVFLATDRSLYRIGWNDAPENTFTFTRLPVDVPAITSNPVWWNGELWVGAGNQIIHVLPGQRWADTVTVDEIGNTPQPFSGRVVQMMSMQQYLVAKLITDLTVSAQDTALTIRNTDGAWYNRRLIQGNIATVDNLLLYKVDATGVALATFTSAGTTTLWPLLGAGKNPNNLAVSIRGQEGIERIIWPVEYGEDEASLKQLKRGRMQVKGVGAASSSNHVRAYCRFDTQDQQGQAFMVNNVTCGGAGLTGIATSSGLWSLALDAYKGAYGDYGSRVNASLGVGYVWQEFDGTAPSLAPQVTAGAISSVAVFGTGSGYNGSTIALTAMPLPGYAGSGASLTGNIVGGAITSVTVNAGGGGYTQGGVIVVANGGKTVNGATSGGSFSQLAGDSTNNSIYPTWHNLTVMAEIGGDTTGTLVPTLVALLFEFNEYSKVEYQYALRFRMRVGDTHITNGVKGDGSAKSKYDTPAAIVADRDALEALKNQHLIAPYTGLDGHTWSVLVTKVSHDAISVDANGIQESETELTVQIQQLLGTV